MTEEFIKICRETGEAYLVTHDGCCHTDDLMSAAVIELLLGENIKYHIVRTRDRVLLEEYMKKDDHIVFDVGDGQFDHHKAEKKIKMDGRELSSIGLIWRYFKQDIISQFGIDEYAWTNIDKFLISFVDHTDNTGEKNPYNYVINNKRNIMGPEKYETFLKLVEFIKNEILKPTIDGEKLIMENRDKFKNLPLLELKNLKFKFNSSKEFVPLSTCDSDLDGYIYKTDRGWGLRGVNGRIIKRVESSDIIFLHPTGYFSEIKYLNEELIVKLFS